MKNFALGVIEDYNGGYLRKPIQVDCMHWEWKNYPTAWKASFQKKLYEKPTIILEMVTS